jgi:hypothetical protein
LQKQNVSIFSKNLGTKTKLFDLFQLFFSKSKTLLYNQKNFRSERERFGSIMNFVSKTNIFDFFLGRWWENESKRSLKNVGLTLLVDTVYSTHSNREVGSVEPEGTLKGQQLTKLGRKYQSILITPGSSPFTGQFF